MTSPIEFILSNPYTSFFGITILLSPFILKYVLSNNKISNLVLTLGITGTFLGVFIGLLNFDTNNIESSVPELLDGLKIAFLTSLAGLIANILIKYFPIIYNSKPRNDEQDITGETFIKKLTELVDINKNMSDSLVILSKSISSDSDTSLVSQLQKLRISNNDGFTNMNKSFEEFANKVVADNTQSLIDALTEVMKDFNNKINEQFGDNFKELNEAVESMLLWQQEYKSQIESLILQYSSIHENIKGIDSSLSNTANSHDKIIESNSELYDIIQDFSSMVDSLAELGEKASTSFPIIEDKLDVIVNKSSELIEGTVDQMKDSYELFEDQQRQISNKNTETINQLLKDSGERISQFEEALNEELNKSLTTLGNSLLKVSEQFADDYEPITRNLKEIITNLDTRNR